MKKRNKIILIITFIMITLGLITSYLDSARVRNAIEPKYTIKIISDNGNKITYWGIGYKVIRYPSVSPKEPYKNNRGVKYGNWFMKYKPVEEKNYANLLTKEDIIRENNLLFSINWGNSKKNCIPVILNVFDNGEYILYTSYQACPPNENCTLMLKYTKSVTGNYDYDVIKILQNSIIADDVSFTNDTQPEYEITPANQAIYSQLITDNQNEYLKEFLNKIGINLKKCATKDYKN